MLFLASEQQLEDRLENGHERLTVGIPPEFLLHRQPHTLAHHVTHLAKFFQAQRTTMHTSKTRLFDTTPWRLRHRIRGDHIVNHDRASLNATRYTVGISPILAKNISIETIDALIGQPDRFLVTLNNHNRQQWAKSFLTHHQHLMIDIGQYGRFIEGAAEMCRTFTTTKNSGSFLNCIAHLALHYLYLPFIYHRANINIFTVSRHPNTQLFRQLYHTLNKSIADVFMHIDTLDRGTYLTTVGKRSPDRSLRSPLNIGISAHNHGVFAT